MIIEVLVTFFMICEVLCGGQLNYDQHLLGRNSYDVSNQKEETKYGIRDRNDND